MPTVFVTVERVLEGMTTKPDVIRYDVNTHETSAALGETYHTLDPWVASLCNRAMALEQPIALTWRDTRYGKQITHVRLMKDGQTAFAHLLAADRKRA